MQGGTTGLGIEVLTLFLHYPKQTQLPSARETLEVTSTCRLGLL